MSTPHTVSLSGLTDGEAQEFHKFYIQGMIIFTVVAVIAHFLVWLWRPWIPPEGGYPNTGAADIVSSLQTVLPMLA